MNELFNNEGFVIFIMALIIFVLTQVLKLPIKYFTKNIKKEDARKMVNTVILLIPFALGILADFLFSTFYTHTSIDIIQGLTYGMGSTTVYELISRLLKIKIKNPYKSGQGKEILDKVEEIKADGKIDKNDIDNVLSDTPEVDKFFNEVK